jgi:hypothetical protein
VAVSDSIKVTFLKLYSALIYKISLLREKVITELLYKTAINRRESRRQVYYTVIAALITIITTFVNTL